MFKNYRPKKKQLQLFECSVLKSQLASTRGFTPPKQKWDKLSEEDRWKRYYAARLRSKCRWKNQQ